MRLSRLNAIAIILFLLAALVSVPAWGASTALPGTINYVEGQASIGEKALDSESVGSAELHAGESLTTGTGRAEILLTPGIFLRLDSSSTLTMISPSLTDTRVELLKGRASVEVAEIYKENSVHIVIAGATAQLLNNGLYEFDANRNVVRVFDGKATVEDQGRQVDVKGGHEVRLNAGDQFKSKGFDKEANKDELYRWSKLRSAYLSDANVDAARIYTGPAWYGGGWYWDPWFGGYTFIPASGVLYSPFGFGFGSPFFFSGGSFFFHDGFHNRFAHDGFHRGPFIGHGFRDGGFHGGGFHSGGFHAGGFHGGGFHGGGGGGFHGGGGGFHGGGGGRR
jgi:FecR protein